MSGHYTIAHGKSIYPSHLTTDLWFTIDDKNRNYADKTILRELRNDKLNYHNMYDVYHTFVIVDITV